MRADGGGDAPEAVADGLYDSNNLFWNKDHEKYLFHILDYPPHGKEFEISGDSY